MSTGLGGERLIMTGPGRHELRRRVRVLVLTAPIGEGHLAAARALSEDILRAERTARR